MSKPKDATQVHRISVELRDREELTSRYLSDFPHGGLLIETAELLAEDDLVELEVVIGGASQRHRLRGVVLWCRGTPGVHSQVGVGLLPSEAEKRERLLGSQPPSPPAGPRARRQQRFATAMKVTYRSSTDFVVDYTRNISTGGLFIDSSQPPAIGTEILLRLYPPGEVDPIDLPSQVVWRQPGRGFGVRFDPNGGPSHRKLERLVRRLALATPRPPRDPGFEEITS
jgi:uncharacterized protein (TIGR02266 family)